MHRFNCYLPIELFERIKLMASSFNLNISKMMIKLLELGYIKILEQGGHDNGIDNK